MKEVISETILSISNKKLCVFDVGDVAGKSSIE